MDTEAYLDQLLGVGRFSSLKDGLYVLKLFSGCMVDIVMHMTVLRDGTVKTRVEVLYNTGEYDCTLYSMYAEPQTFYTKDIDRVELFLSGMKKKWDSTVKRVVEEELGKIGD